jgi:hypothetical protein
MQSENKTFTLGECKPFITVLMTADFFVSEKKKKTKQVIIITLFNQATRMDWQYLHTASL